jgi:hypothetical protein
MHASTQVVEAATEDYPEIHDLLNRFRTLKEANRDLTLAQIRDEGENEALRDEYGGYTKARANEMLDGNNHVSGLQKDLERGVHEAYLLQVRQLAQAMMVPAVWLLAAGSYAAASRCNLLYGSTAA